MLFWGHQLERCVRNGKDTRCDALRRVCGEKIHYSREPRNKRREPVAFFGGTSGKILIFDKTDCSEWSAINT
jgi:hypothetical protein